VRVLLLPNGAVPRRSTGSAEERLWPVRVRRGTVQGTRAAASATSSDDMSAGADLYAVLGLKKECTDAELRVAYRRLAMVRAIQAALALILSQINVAGLASSSPS
jgi:hypothetical protein